MITLGCYNTLVTVRKRLESRENQDDDTMDDQDKISLELVRKWIPGDRNSPKDWRCTRDGCAFYKRFCKYSQ
jgi:hypothetical protein